MTMFGILKVEDVQNGREGERERESKAADVREKMDRRVENLRLYNFYLVEKEFENFKHA